MKKSLKVKNFLIAENCLNFLLQIFIGYNLEFRKSINVKNFIIEMNENDLK